MDYRMIPFVKRRIIIEVEDRMIHVPFESSKETELNDENIIKRLIEKEYNVKVTKIIFENEIK
jgi:hypothetical protein